MQACASQPSTSIRIAHLISALIEANGSEAQTCMLCGDKIWGAIMFWGWFGYKHLAPLNRFKNPRKHRHTHFTNLLCLENQDIRKKNSFSLTLDNRWKGKIHTIWHSFIWSYSLSSIWIYLMVQSLVIIRSGSLFIHALTNCRVSSFNFRSVTLGTRRTEEHLPFF